MVTQFDLIKLPEEEKTGSTKCAGGAGMALDSRARRREPSYSFDVLRDTRDENIRNTVNWLGLI